MHISVCFFLALVPTLDKVTSLTFPVLCAHIQGWLNIAQHSYCVTVAKYNYSDAKKACSIVNSTLADVHSVKNILNPILIALGLGNRANVTIWINGTRQGKERLLQMNGILNFTFETDALSLKHRVFCERGINQHQGTSDFYPVASSSTNMSSNLSTSTFAKQSTSYKTLKISITSTASTTSPALKLLIRPTISKLLPISQVSNRLTSSAITKLLPTAAVATPSTASMSSQMSKTSTTSNLQTASTFTILSTTSTESELPMTSAISVLSATGSISTIKRDALYTTSSMPISSASTSIVLVTESPKTTVSETNGSTKTSATRSDPWVRVETNEYYVNYGEYNYTSAVDFCKTLANSSLTTFFSSIQFFKVLNQLNVSNGSYWIGANNDNYSQGCLSYHRYTKTLSTSNCTQKMFSICYRPTFNNVTDILENVFFRKMLRDMTVYKTETVINKRKYISVNNDHRWSTKAVAGISLLILCFVVLFLLMLDLTKFAVCCRVGLCKKRNVKQTEKKAQKCDRFSGQNDMKPF